MAAGSELRSKIKSVENTKKITKAMQMVAASKMRKAQERMRSARPYSDKIRQIAANLALANPEYSHPFLLRQDKSRVVGMIIVTTDKGLCGGLNTNVLRMVTNQMRKFEQQGKKIQTVVIGSKGFSFLNHIGVKIIADAVQLGETLRMEKLLGPVKVMTDAYIAGEIDMIYICYNKFINTMNQQPMFEQLIPLASSTPKADHWDYLYEPDPKTVIDELLMRYVEALIYQSVAENMASEQSARMMAMKAATDNAGNLIDELKLLYNKMRQAAITKEISEIVSGAAAV